jgi:hypothetical protein
MSVIQKCITAGISEHGVYQIVLHVTLRSFQIFLKLCKPIVPNLGFKQPL